MSFGDALIDDRGLEACAVVGDGQHDPVPCPEQPDGHLGRARVLVDVREQFPCRPVEQRLRGGSAHVFEVGIDDEVAAGLVLAQQFPHARCEPELSQDLRMQRRHRRAKARRRVVERRVDHVEGRVGNAFAHLVEFHPRGQQSLQRAVVQMLGEVAVGPLVGLHRLGNQTAAHVEERRDTGRPTGQHQTQRRGGDGQPQ